MQLALRGTFIDEVLPKLASSQRSRSEPPTGPLGSSIFQEESRYVLALEARARRHFQRDSLELGETKKLFSRLSSPGADSDDSDFTQCPPSPRSQHFQHDSLDSLDDFPGVMELFSSETTMCTLADISNADDDLTEYSPKPRAQQSRKEMAADPLFTTQCTPPSIQAAVVEREAPASRAVATGVWSIGSIGHPGLCSRPCIHFSRGMCGEGEDCRFCHVAHSGRNAHLDKRNRELLSRLTFAQRATVSLPILRRQLVKLGLAAHARELLDALESIAREATWDAKTRRECASLTSALGALSFRSMMMAISKAPDAPDSLKGTELEAHLEQIRMAGGETRQR